MPRSSGSSVGSSVVGSSVSTPAVKIDEADASTTYFGFAAPGSNTANAVWQIKKLTVSGTVTTVQYADGNSKYDNVWDNRAALSYS